MRTNWFRITLLTGLVVALAGCVPAGSIQVQGTRTEPAMPAQATTAENQNVEQPVTKTDLPTVEPLKERVVTPQPIPVTPFAGNETLIEQAREDLAQRLSIESTQISLLEVIEVVWPDSSLGCPKPESSYLQVLTPGYLIRLQAKDRVLEYHTDMQGMVVYCENPSPLPLESLPRE